MPPFRSIAGRRFGRLVAIRRTPNNKGRQTRWLCICDCGIETTVNRGGLTTGNTQSCGCLGRERSGDAQRVHGLIGHPDYDLWAGMVARCNNKNHTAFRYYGGRGIKVCERWRNFGFFISDMGDRPSRAHSIDRIDTDRGYEPGNCKWELLSVNSRRQRKTKYFTIGDKTKSLREWCETTGIHHQTVRSRLQRGLPIESAILPLRNSASRSLD